jgi:hypothetical protein
MQRFRYLVGLLTLAAAAAGAAYLLRVLSGHEHGDGMAIRVEFRDARGLRAGAAVRYRGVAVGTVRSVHVTDDGNKAVADLDLDPTGSAHASVDSSFWIVTPRFSGLTGGASGLDTLVRDAYVAFLTPANAGSALFSGGLVTGSERPPAASEVESLEPVLHGDLLMSLLVPENHGLKPGSPVVFRGINTGEVRSIELAADGSHVEVKLRIAQGHRQTVTDKAMFWVARPHLSGALFSGFTLSEIGAALMPYVAYYAEPGKGVPVEDGFRAAATAERPDLAVADVPLTAVKNAAAKPAISGEPLHLVRVVYAAVQVHTFSSDTPIRREGTGVLWLDRSGRAVVATARSLVDASYTESGWFGRAPTIGKEQLKVLLSGGPVLHAGRVWVEPGGKDLAALVVEDVPPDLLATPPAQLLFDGKTAAVDATLRLAREDGTLLPPQPLGEPWPEVPTSWGAAVLHGDQVFAVYGRKGGREVAPAVAALELIPDDLRPKPGSPPR